MVRAVQVTATSTGAANDVPFAAVGGVVDAAIEGTSSNHAIDAQLLDTTPLLRRQSLQWFQLPQPVSALDFLRIVQVRLVNLLCLFEQGVVSRQHVLPIVAIFINLDLLNVVETLAYCMTDQQGLEQGV